MALEAVAVETARAAGPNMQYAGLKQHCVFYTDATRTLCSTRAELLAQNCREFKGTIRAEKKGGQRRQKGAPTLTRRKPPEEIGAALYRWLGLGAAQHSGKAATTRRAPRSRTKSTAGRGLITEFVRADKANQVTSATLLSPTLVTSPGSSPVSRWISRSRYWRLNLAWARAGERA